MRTPKEPITWGDGANLRLEAIKVVYEHLSRTNQNATSEQIVNWANIIVKFVKGEIK